MKEFELEQEIYDTVYPLLVAKNNVPEVNKYLTTKIGYRFDLYQFLATWCELVTDFEKYTHKLIKNKMDRWSAKALATMIIQMHDEEIRS